MITVHNKEYSLFTKAFIFLVYPYVLFRRYVVSKESDLFAELLINAHYNS